MAALIQSTRALNPQRFIAQPNNQFTYSLVGNEGLVTFLEDGSSRLCIENDVLSIQPDGTAQGRVAGTAGAYELFTAKGNVAEFRPASSDGASFLVATGSL